MHSEKMRDRTATKVLMQCLALPTAPLFLAVHLLALIRGIAVSACLALLFTPSREAARVGFFATAMLGFGQASNGCKMAA